MRRTVGGGPWEDTDGGTTIADAVWTIAGMSRTDSAGSMTTAHALFSVATTVEPESA